MAIYNNFEEVAQEISEKTPPIIYKYRDWGNDFHKTIVTKNEVYFAHPHSLNDPYDVRPPYNFVVPEFDQEVARKRIREAGKAIRPDLTEEQLEHEVEQRLQNIISDPIGYFKRSRMDYVLDSSKYDSIGILSLCSSFGNEPMWAHYGNNHNGFAVGFNSVKLAEALNCSFGYVDYSDQPLDYFIMGDNSGLLERELFRKSAKWSSEEELRFLTVGIGLYRDRVSTFPADAVEEIVFGLNTNPRTQQEVIELANKTLPVVDFFKVATKADGYGFEKMRL